MALKRILTPATYCTSLDQLDAIVSILQRHGFLSRNQTSALLNLGTPELPTIIVIEQREKKGATYITLKGRHYMVNNRAQVTRVNT